MPRLGDPVDMETPEESNLASARPQHTATQRSISSKVDTKGFEREARKDAKQSNDGEEHFQDEEIDQEDIDECHASTELRSVSLVDFQYQV